MNHVEIHPFKGNWLRLYIETEDQDKYFELGSIVNDIPVAKFVEDMRCHLISLHHYGMTVRAFEKKGVEVRVHKSVPIKYRKLRKAISRRDIDSMRHSPKLWTDNKKNKLLNYQRTGMSLTFNRRKFILADDMGVGKTPQAIGTMLHGFENGYKRALIICMSSLKHQWEDEILKFTKLKKSDIIILGEGKYKCNRGLEYNGRSKDCKKCNEYDNCKMYKSNPDKLRKHQLVRQKNTRVVITNYEMIAKYAQQIMSGGFDIYIADEVSKVKNYGTKMTKAMMRISRNFKDDDIFLPMSGTLIENCIQEFYPVFTMIDETIFGTWTNFKNCFLICDFWGRPVGVKNEDLLQKITSRYILRRTVDQVWKDRPELFEITRICEMSPIQRKIYKDVANGQADKLRGGIKLNSAQLATIIGYLIMVADSAETVQELGKHKAEDFSCKLDMLKSLLNNEVSDKVVIFSKYANKVIPLIKRELVKDGHKCLVITGAVKAIDRRVIRNKFKTGNYKALICSDSMTYGANLQMAKYVINFDLPWNPAVLDQRIRRVYRRGQKHPVTYINLIVKDSVEDMILDKIYTKKAMFSKYMGTGVKPINLLREISVKDLLRNITG